MFRKLLALLVIMVTPAFAQEVTYTDPTQIPIADQTYTVIQQQTPTPIEEIKNTGGTALTLYDDGVSQLIGLGFDFYFYGNLYNSVYVSQNGFINFTNNANGCCSGNPLPFFTEWTEQNAASFQYFSVNNSIFAMWSDLADFNDPGNPYYKLTNNSFVVGWYGIEELGTPNKFNFEISLFSDSSFSINYGTFDYAAPTGRTFTSGFQGDQAGEFYQIYNGNDPSSLQNTTYYVQSSEVVPPPPPPPPPPPEEPPIAPDCTINPTNPTCIINDIIDITDPVLVADTNTGSDTGSDDGSTTSEEIAAEEEEQAAEEEMLAAVEESFEEAVEEQEEALEELLAEQEEAADEMTEEAVVAAYRELTDEEKAAILADAISKNTLEAALSIASAAENNAIAQGGISTDGATSNSESSSRTSTIVATSEMAAEISSTTTATSELFVEAVKEESSTNESSNAGSDILEAGRQLGQAALATTLAGASESATESSSQAENIASNSAAESQVASATGSSIVDTNMSVDVPVFAEIRAEENTVVEIQMEMIEPLTENNDVNVAEIIQQSEQSSAVDFTSIDAVMEMFAGNIANQITVAAEQEELENNIIQQSVVSSQTSQEETNTFSEAEAVTIASDPALANAFNMAPNVANLEATGVLSQKQEEKSDAELRAEQVVAANKEEQDKINSNYMEADQSGIVAAIGSETDVSSYRTAMIRDNNVWYKPEDIYKNIVIKDNVRGSYFLEKGNTDTYKQMIEDQYK